MKFLLDENISPKTAQFLKELGHYAIHVREVNLKGASDDKIFEYAKQHGLLLITIDRDFGNIMDYPPGTHHGIIRLKLRHMPSGKVNSVLQSFLAEINSEDIYGNLAILEEDRYRIRKKML